MRLLTIEEYNEETVKHVENVRKLLRRIEDMLAQRAVEHDHSKLESPEAEMFCEYTPKLKRTTYGSTEYFENLRGLGTALDHHYKNNRHHPEHFDDGVFGMNLIDVVEMFCDWYASSLRHDDGDIFKSIDFNTYRFDLGDQLKSILLNTARIFAEGDA